MCILQEIRLMHFSGTLSILWETPVKILSLVLEKVGILPLKINIFQQKNTKNLRSSMDILVIFH